MKFLLSLVIAAFCINTAVAQNEQPGWFVLDSRVDLTVSEENKATEPEVVQQEEPVVAEKTDSEKKISIKKFEDNVRFAKNNKDLELAYNWLKKEFKQEQTKNILLSPLDFYLSSVLLANGVVDQTLFEFSKMFSVMRLAEVNQNIKTYIMHRSSNTSIQLALWGKVFSEHFSELMRKQLDAEIWGLSDTTAVINEWVKAKTYGKISNIIPEESVSETDMFLVSSAYFETPWSGYSTPFVVEKKEFHNLDGRFSETDMFHNEIEADYFENNEMYAVRLFFDTGDYISLFMPINENDFGRFVEKIDSFILKPNFEKKLVNITFPKMDVEYQSNIIRDVYKMLGIQRIFEKGNYEFAKMVSFDNTAFIKDVLLKARVKLDESKEIEAAKDEKKITPPSEKVIFNANRPFVFMINSGDFIGTMVKAD